ncbi:MAG: Peptide/nickel transport system substrate-binding protein [Rhodospirillales bacterium]|jgi:peptide/nickel transport system substrate-binding protein|nr:Peptide/nickel transport system substrate-binding protein [Rhodospirillales bacterium]
MLDRLLAWSAWTATAAIALVSPALAQKDKDTLRFGFQDPISTVEVVLDPKPETIMTNDAVFDGLVWYDPASRSYKPALAESWSRIDDKTLEFKLRRDVKFHDGTAMTADDVAYTFGWLIDPASKLRYVNLDFVARIEKIDDYTIRLIEKQPSSYDLSRLPLAPVYPKAVHGALADKAEFGRKRPIGTGPYKVESIDSTRGVVLVRNDLYPLASEWRPAGQIKQIQIVPIPDLQTEIAQLITGGLDVIHDLPKDLAEQLAGAPNVTITASTGPNYFYMEMDSVNRSGNAALAKPEVRKAIAMAIDRTELAEHVVTGGKAVTVIDALCLPSQSDCPPTLAAVPPRPDAAAAKKLLAAAGYPDGFDVDITSIPGAQALAEAIAGDLRKIGVRAKVDHKTFGSYREKETQNKLEILVAHFWSAGASPWGTLDRFFGPPARDYFHDEEINRLKAAGASELDDAKRIALWRQIFERINERGYIMPLTTFPSVFASADNVVIGTGALNPGGADLNRIHWK